jgi:hypothetical protein
MKPAVAGATGRLARKLRNHTSVTALQVGAAPTGFGKECRSSSFFMISSHLLQPMAFSEMYPGNIFFSGLCEFQL